MYLFLELHIAYLLIFFPPFGSSLSFLRHSWEVIFSCEKHGVLESEVNSLFNSLVYLIKLTTLMKVVWYVL